MQNVSARSGGAKPDAGSAIAKPAILKRATLPILHVSRVGYVGGAERVMLTLLEGLQSRHFKPYLACPGEGGLATAAQDRGVAVYPASLSRMRATLNLAALAAYPRAIVDGQRRILEICQRQSIALVHAHHPIGALYCRMAVKRARVPLVLHVHDGLPVAKTYSVALRFAASIADRIVCVSGAAKAAADTSGVTIPADIVANGLDPIFLSAPKQAPPPELGTPGPHIGVFAALEPRKGQHVFVQAAALVARQMPSAKFWLIGQSGSQANESYEHHLRQLAASPELAGKVFFADARDDVVAWMQAIDLVVLPSLSHETLGMVLIEAMALGTPVVASRLGGIPDAVSDGETGTLVSPGDPLALAEAMQHSVISRDPAMRARCGRCTNEIFTARVLRSHGANLRRGPQPQE